MVLISINIPLLRDICYNSNRNLLHDLIIILEQIGREGNPEYKWYEIQDTIDYWKEFEKDKIVYPEICHKMNLRLTLMGIYK